MEIEENKKKKPKIREAILWCMRDKENPKASKKDIRDYYSKKGFELEESFFEHLLRANGKDYYEENGFIGFREFSPTLENEYMKISRKKEAENSIDENEVEKSENKSKIQIVAKKENKKSLQDKNEKDIENKDIENFAHFTGYLEGCLDDLSVKADKEKWGIKNAILKSHIKEYFKVISLNKEKYFAFSEDGKYMCFNTGLLTPYCSDIYAVFSKNTYQNKDKYYKEWRFKEWATHSQSEKIFIELPPYHNFLQSKEDVIFNPDYEITYNVEHILEENEDRFPESFRKNNQFNKVSLLSGTLTLTKIKISRDHRIAVPQYYNNELGFFLPMYFSNEEKPIALAVAKKNNKYHVNTCLTLDMAYKNARVVGKVESSWLKLD